MLVKNLKRIVFEIFSLLKIQIPFSVKEITETIISHTIKAITIPFTKPITPPKVVLSLPTILNENILFNSFAKKRAITSNTIISITAQNVDTSSENMGFIVV